MVYDCVIVGAGPAGLTAAIYQKRANKNVLLLERSLFGGQVATLGNIENYPGYASIDGPSLAENFYAQAKKLQVPIKYDDMQTIKDGKIKQVVCKKQTYEAKSVILALGSVSRELAVEGEKQFFGKGVSYCATCDGAFFKGKKVAVVGSGDSAVASALYLKNICGEVVIISKYPELKLKSYQPNIMERLEGIKIYYGAMIKKIIGTDKVEGVELSSLKRPLKLDGVFVTIGRRPDTDGLKGVLELDEKGYIITDEQMHTSIKGVYACGDVRSKAIKQIVTAAASGAVASTKAMEEMEE